MATGSAYTASVAGTYQLEVRDVVYDAATCPALFKSVPVVVIQPPTVNAGSNQTVCTSSPTASINGSITNATGGTWTGGLGTYSPNNTSQSISYTPHASEITAGSVTLTLTSTGAGGGCSNTSASVTITYPPLLANTVPSYTLACNASTTPIVPVISGGTQPYSYSWNNGATTSSIVAGSGVYCLTVTDSRGCTKASCSTITVPSALVISAGASGVAPPLSMTGSATVTPTGGTVPYTYLWSVSTTSQTTQIATALFSGSHSVVVTDANGCSKNASVVVQEPNCSDLVVTVTGTNVNCFGNTTGSATVTATGTAGAAPPYSYSWTSPAQTTQVISGLSAGIYQVLATTTVGCSSVQQITITEPALLSSSMSHTDVTLVGGNDGTATATITGGTTPYTYAWTPSGGTNSVATGLVMGNYTVSVIDAKGCALTNTVQVNQPSCTALVLNMSATNVSCFSGSNGTATASLLFGTAPYSYAWSVGGTTSTISAQLAGPLTVTVTDAVNCVLQNTITITQPTALTLTLVATDVLCYGGQTGTLNLTVAGGTFPYT